VIAMAHNLNLRVVAEGAEPPEQVSFLRNQDCDEMQGFFTSRPVPAADAQPILLDGHCKKIAGIAAASAASTRP
ncbi:MAG: EAL domain-containing protein, partial [Pseudomonadota bacterium]